MLANAGHEPPRPAGRRARLDRLAARAAGTTFALEGFVPTAGAALDWFARIGALPAGPELDALLRDASADAGVVCVPALQGLGTPSWDAAARGALFGIDLGTTRADLARAVVDGVLHQVADALDALAAASSSALDGGLARSGWIVQRLADLAGIRVERTSRDGLDGDRRRHARGAGRGRVGVAGRAARRSRPICRRAGARERRARVAPGTLGRGRRARERRSGRDERGALGPLRVVERHRDERLGGRRLAPATRQTSAIGHVRRLGPVGRSSIGGPAISATDRGITATPRPLDVRSRTAAISVQMNALRGSSPSSAMVRSSRRRSAELSR